MSPYEQSARVLDAAAAGDRVPGYEAVGDLLIALGQVEPIAPGAALSAAAVEAASAATTASGTGVVATAVLKPFITLLAVGGLAVGGVVISSGDDAPTLTEDPIPTETEGVLGDEPNQDVEPDVALSSTTTEPVSTTVPGESVDAAASDDEMPLTEATSPEDTPPPTTSSPPSPTPTTSAPPADSNSAGTDSDSDTGDEPEQYGNNGNGNGNGVGNGKGNKGRNGG